MRSIVKFSILSAFLVLSLGCGPSRSELHAAFDDCYAEYVSPYDRETLAIRDVDNFLSGLQPNQLITVSEFLDLLEVGGISQYVAVDFGAGGLPSNAPITFTSDDLYQGFYPDGWSQILWGGISAEVSARSNEMYEFCDERYAERFG